jgi:arylsulfatase A-like enzyme
MAAGSAGLAASAPGQARRRPNILYIMTDQQRTDTLGCYGNPKAHTPVLDALAGRGLRFSSCYATQPVCSPCRSSMLTGLFPSATGVVENNIPLPAGHYTWPRALHAEGYRTAYIGKWHLGDDPAPDYFDIWQGYHTGWPHWIKKEPVYQHPGESKAAYEARAASAAHHGENVGRYRPDLETDHAIDFIRACGDQPFLCWLSYYPPHTEKTVPEEDLAIFRGRFDSEEQDIYHAMVHRLDSNIGRLLRELDALGLRQNTLVVFVSDHGENHPFRWNQHHKRLCTDQSANVPLILSWPGALPEGALVDPVFSVADLMPTLLDLCGMPVPEGIHGRSGVRLLHGDAAGWRDDVFIQNSPYRADAKPIEGRPVAAMRERAVVTNDWKLILNNQRPPELYRRHAGPPDTDNVHGDPGNAGVVQDLRERLRAWGERTGDSITRALLA